MSSTNLGGLARAEFDLMDSINGLVWIESVT